MHPSLKILRTILLGLLTSLVGIFCIVITLGQFFNWNAPFLPNKGELEPVILGAIATLLVGVGLEQSFHFVTDRQDDRLNDLELLVKESIGVRYLKTTDEIESTGLRLIGAADRQYRTIVYGKGPKGSPRFIEGLARKFRQLKRMGKGPEVKAVIAVDLQNIPTSFQAEVDKRYAMYKKHGIEDVLSISLLDIKHVIGCDIQIIDKKHMVLTHTPFPSHDMQRSILFENQPIIVADYVEWFDNHILPKTIPYSTWKSQHNQTP